LTQDKYVRLRPAGPVAIGADATGAYITDVTSARVPAATGVDATGAYMTDVNSVPAAPRGTDITELNNDESDALQVARLYESQLDDQDEKEEERDENADEDEEEEVAEPALQRYSAAFRSA
jgi:hypothetical protein